MSFVHNMERKVLTGAIFVTLCAAIALPHEDGSTKRVVEKRLSDVKHFNGIEHDIQFDHEAFLGKEAEKFEDLTPEEAKNRLKIIFQKIDGDKDELIDSDELRKWIQYTHRRYTDLEVEQQWRVHNPNNKDEITWLEYSKANYGFLETEPTSSQDYKTYTRMKERDRRRWKVADMDSNDALNKEEMSNFLRPENVEHMKDILVHETVEDIDKNEDGKISADEFISDLYRGEPGDEEPSWVAAERETFKNYRDKNGDGILDFDEVKEWIHPINYDQVLAETNHLIASSDQDGDKKLSQDEVLESYDLFVGSQATEFGEALVKHDEF